MPSTLKEAIDSLRALQRQPDMAKKVSDELLGKYKGIIPIEKTSTEFIRELRESLFGKLKG